MEKPHRFLIDKVSSYAEEGAAYMRRRRLRSQPFARIGRAGGRIDALETDRGRGLELIESARSLLGEDRLAAAGEEPTQELASEPGGTAP
jgi:hypothetical protein